MLSDEEVKSWDSYILDRQMRYEKDLEDPIYNLKSILRNDEPGQFLWELLQNAEDAGATKVKIEVHPEKLIFQHNSVDEFTFNDAKAISKVGISGKNGRESAIGQFGIGFKAVFRYTKAVQIKTSQLSFAIVDFIKPEQIEADKSLKLSKNFTTGFTINFDSADTDRSAANQDILAVLTQWNENTIIFLKNLEELQVISQNLNYVIRKTRVDKNIITIELSKDGKSLKSNWLHFMSPTKVEVLDGNDKYLYEKVSYVGFAMKVDIGENFYHPIPIENASIFTFFPLKREESKLKFHIHAPFAINSQRTLLSHSVKGEEINKRMIFETANLLASKIADLFENNKVDLEFLEILPNSNDDIPSEYNIFLTKLRDIFQSKPLLNVGVEKKYVPWEIARADLDIYNLLKPDDGITFYREVANNLGRRLGDNLISPVLIMPNSKSARVNVFLTQIGVANISRERFVDFIIELNKIFKRNNKEHVSDEILTKYFMWLARKSTANIRDLYLLIFKNGLKRSDLEFIPFFWVNSLNSTSPFKPVTEVYLSTLETKDDLDVLIPEIFPSESNGSKEYSTLQSFFDSIGVEVKDPWIVLKNLYGSKTNGQGKGKEAEPERMSWLLEMYLLDRERFLALTRTTLKIICENTKGETYWNLPSNIVLQTKDSLVNWEVLNSICNADEQQFFLWSGYTQNETLVSFLLDLGSHENLFLTGSLTRRTISCLNGILSSNDLTLVSTLWDLLFDIKNFGDFECYTSRTYLPTKLKTSLLEFKWIPKKDGTFVTPYYCVEKELHENFSYEDALFLIMCDFGGEQKDLEAKSGKADSAAKEMGFDSAEAHAVAIEFMKQHSLEDIKKMLIKEKMDENQSVGDAFGILEDLQEAESTTPEIEREIESVLSRSNYRVTQLERRQNLRKIYGKLGDISCQLCQRTSMPFKYSNLDSDGIRWDYFETVAFFAHAKTESNLNGLALCPTCAAKIKHFRRSIPELIEFNLRSEITRLQKLVKTDELVDPKVLKISVTVLGSEEFLKFSRLHILQLFAVLESNN